MRLFYLQIFLFVNIFSGALNGQAVQQLQQATDSDSSYYDIYRLSSGDVWVAGEYGVLKSINKKGEVSEINYPNNGSNLLKLLQLGDFVFMAADNGTIYRYHLPTQNWIVKEFRTFSNRCFYDICEGSPGTIVVCGGSSGVAVGKRLIPNGFIAYIDTSFSSEPVISWKNTRKFVWALLKQENGKILASVFNGISTHLYEASDSTFDFASLKKIPGLIHGLTEMNGKVYYSGCRSVNSNTTGIWGILGEGNATNSIPNSGFIYNLVMQNDKLYGFSQKGFLYQLEPGKAVPLFKTDQGFAFYEALPVDQNALLLAGHGKSLIRLDLGN